MLPVFLPSAGPLRTAAAREKGDGRKEWMAKTRARAATVFSPPLRSAISRNRLVGGITLYLTPPWNGSSGFSRLRYAVPPKSVPSSPPPVSSL